MLSLSSCIFYQFYRTRISTQQHQPLLVVFQRLFVVVQQQRRQRRQQYHSYHHEQQQLHLLIRNNNNSYKRSRIDCNSSGSSNCSSNRRYISSSIGFSGAGFLIVYHLGVAACLSDQCISLSAPLSFTSTSTTMNQKYSNHPTIRFTGVSSGSLVATALLAHVNAEKDGMDAVLNIYTTTQHQTCNSIFNTLQPGFSLIDIVEDIFTKLILQSIQNHYNDPNDFLQIVNEYQLLRIGLTDRTIFPPIGYNPNAYVYVDTFHSIQDIISSCLLSSYIPGITGPILGNMAFHHQSISRASKHMYHMIQAGCMKKGTTGEVIQIQSQQQQEEEQQSISNASTITIGNSSSTIYERERYWDGGLVNAFPTIDSKTVIVSPVAADFYNNNNNSINPSIEYNHTNNNNSSNSSSNNFNQGRNNNTIIPKMVLNPNVTIHLTTQTLASLRYMILTNNSSQQQQQQQYPKDYEYDRHSTSSSTGTEFLQKKFIQGYDNTKQYLMNKGLISIHHHFISKNKNKITTVSTTKLQK